MILWAEERGCYGNRHRVRGVLEFLEKDMVKRCHSEWEADCGSRLKRDVFGKKKRSWKVLNLNVRNLKFVYWAVKRYYYRHCPRRSPGHQSWGGPGLPSFSWIHSRDLPARIPGLLPSSNICQGIYMQGLWAGVLVLVSSLVGPWSRSHGDILQRCNRHSLLAASECPSCVLGSGAPQEGV